MHFPEGVPEIRGLKFGMLPADGREVKPLPADAQALKSAPLIGQRFVARQPIFDRTQ